MKTLTQCTTTALGAAALLAAALPATAQAGEWSYSGYLKNETSAFTSEGQPTGRAGSTQDISHHERGELLKFENSLRIFANYETDSGDTSVHLDLNLIRDEEAIDQFQGYRDSSQYDYLREAYVDTQVGPVYLRVGKQQVVWGTADGIKLLDIINPTDWREFVQNTMEDSRVPVWMVKGDVNVGDSGEMQFVISQRKENVIPGMDATGDPNHPFLMKGIDSITGRVNGFLNITPALGQVSNTFFNAYNPVPGLQNVVNMSVQDYVNGGGGGSAANLNAIAQGTNGNRTNLIDGSNWDANNPNSAFEYMNNATFATFDSFVNARSAYRRDYPHALDPNLGLRYRGTLGEDFNYSLNYLWHYDPNPYIEMHWEGQSGDRLNVITEQNGAYTTVRLRDASGNAYGGNAGRVPTLVFTEKLNRIHSIGGSFDTAIDTSWAGPVVLRGEALYQVGTKQPVIDRTKLGYGDLVGAMQMEDADVFKYVAGADFTFFTNMMVSGQFIQFINLDYVDQAGNGSANSGRYTADMSTMHLSNGLKKGAEYEEFFSFFLSKPFGPEQQGRWNNITLYEEGGGWWNRFDVEYGFTDTLVATAEFNKYWGNADTMLGQFEKSSNVQVGLKYLF